MLHALGRDDEALAELHRAADARSVAVTFLGVDPRWDELRGMPEFDAVLERVNLHQADHRHVTTHGSVKV